MKFYQDTETGEIIPDCVLRNEFERLQAEDPETYNYSFSDYIRNCTDKNGFLEET